MVSNKGGRAFLIDRGIQRQRIKKVGFRPRNIYTDPTIPKKRRDISIIRYWERPVEKRKEVMMKIKGRSCEFAPGTCVACDLSEFACKTVFTRLAEHLSLAILSNLHRISLRFAGFFVDMLMRKREEKSKLQFAFFCNEKIPYENSFSRRRKAVHSDALTMMVEMIGFTEHYYGNAPVFRRKQRVS